MGKSTRSHTSVDVPCQATRPAIQSRVGIKSQATMHCAMGRKPGDSRESRFRKKENRQMARQTLINASWSVAVVVVVWANPNGAQAQVLKELIGGAKKKTEKAFTSRPNPLLGRPAFSERPAAFQKKIRPTS